MHFPQFKIIINEIFWLLYFCFEIGGIWMNNIDVFQSKCITKRNILIISYRVVEHCVKKLEHYLEITKMGEIKRDFDFRKQSCEPFVLHKDIFNETSPRSPLSTQNSDSIDLETDEVVDLEIDEVGEVTKEVVLENENKKPEKEIKFRSGGAKSFSSRKSRPPSGKTKPNDDSLEASYKGSYLLKQSRDLVSSGGNLQKALDLALQAMKYFDKCANQNPSLEFFMCLDVVASLYCKLGKYEEAIPFLERAIDIPMIDEGKNHALAKFARCMQLGDTYAMIGQMEKSLLFYNNGLEIQRKMLGEKDPKFGETCKYVAEAHVHLFQFEEAEKLCKFALDTHNKKGSSPSLQEASDQRLMGLIYDSKGNYETALEHYVLARTAMFANQHEKEAALIDINIGDAYLSLAKYDEAIFSYQKALDLLKPIQGENHPSVACVLVRLADLYNKIGKYGELKSYCEHAISIYSKHYFPSEEIGSDLVKISAIYESMNELEQAVEVLCKAIKVYKNVSAGEEQVAGIEAQMGVLYYLMGSYSDSYYSLKNAVSKFREIGKKQSALFGVLLNQMGLACVQINAIHEAVGLFEESRSILEKEYGPYHIESLGVCSNLAGTYDALGRSSDAIEILEYVVGVREQKLGTANPDGDDEKRRLTELLKEAGRVRNRKSRSLETLLETNYHNIDEDEFKDV